MRPKLKKVNLGSEITNNLLTLYKAHQRQLNKVFTRVSNNLPHIFLKT